MIKVIFYSNFEMNILVYAGAEVVPIAYLFIKKTLANWVTVSDLITTRNTYLNFRPWPRGAYWILFGRDNKNKNLQWFNMFYL